MEQTKKYALILGGSSGLGLASAHALAEKGYNLYIVHRNRKADQEQFEKEVACMQSAGVTVSTFNKDALKPENIQYIAGKLSKHSLSVVIHSIAKGSLKPLSPAAKGLSKIDLDITLHAMATSWWQWMKELLAQERISNSCSNIAFTSEGTTKVWPSYGAVASAKATLEALMRQMAVELAPHGITTNCIQAGTTITPSFKMIPHSDKLI